MQIITVAPASPHLKQVQQLWRLHSDTLGYFPSGAFDDHAAKGHILGVLNDDICIGYLLYRVARRRASIVHLCIENHYRGQHLAKRLIEALSSRTQSLAGIGLFCRRDFTVNAAWPHLGFIPKLDKPGRSKGKELTYWWRDHNHPTIFTASQQDLLAEKTALVLDANVFYDIVEENDTPKNEESKALNADWLQEVVELCITPEIHNEINRNPNAQERRKYHNVAQGFITVPADHEAQESALEALKLHFGDPASSSGLSDLRQLSWTIGTGFQFFITRDEGVLQKFEFLYETFGITVIRPSDAIVHFDSLRREALYRPNQLAGTHLSVRPLQMGEQDEIAPLLQNTLVGESRAQFLGALHRFAARPDRYQSVVIESHDFGILGLLVYDRSKSDCLNIPLFRIRKLPTAPSLAPTLVRHLILKSLATSAREGRTYTQLSDRASSSIITQIFEDDGFLSCQKYWQKLNLHFAGTSREFGFRLNQTGVVEEALVKALTSDTETIDRGFAVDLERTFWPAKVTDAPIPTYIVPIRPHWAHDLFDEGLARQTLFGANEKLILNRESVYYRAKNPGSLTAPGRILWYVSSKGDYEGIQSIRACSVLNEVVVGSPKELYRQFKRLGVYQWKNVLDVAKGDMTRDIMALRFGFTEMFSQPIGWHQVQDILRSHGKGSPLQSPYCITAAIFEEIYKLGMGFE